MPRIRYTLKVEDPSDVFTESDTFPPTNDPRSTIQTQIVDPLNRRRDQLKLSRIEIIDVTVESDCVHAHNWKRTHINAFALKAHYSCSRCGITGYKTYHLAKGEGQIVVRDDAFKKEKFAICRDTLKALPKSIF